MLGSGKTGQFIVFLLVFMSVLGGIAITNKPKRVLFAVMAMVLPWQGGLWINQIDLETRYAYILMVPLLLIASSTGKRFRVSTRTLPIAITLLGLLFGWALVAAAGAIKGSFAVGGATTILLDILIVVTVVKFVEDEGDFKFAIKCLMAGVIFQCCLSLVQYKVGGFQVGVIDAVRWQRWRMSGTLLHPNAFGMYLLMLLPLVFRQTLVYFNSNRKEFVKWLIFFIVAGFVFYTTKNRGSWVGFTFGMSLTLAYDFFRRGAQGRKFRKIIMRTVSILAVILAIAMIRYGPRIQERMFESNADRNWDRRQMLVDDAYPIIKANAVFGVGMRNYRQHVDTEFVHNMYLMMAAEIGIPGLIGYCLLFLAFVIASFKLMLSKNVTVSNLAGGFMAAGLGMCVSSIAGPDFFVNHGVRMHYWVLFGLVIALSRLVKSQGRRRVPRQAEPMQGHPAGLPQQHQIAPRNRSPVHNGARMNGNGASNLRRGGIN